VIGSKWRSYFAGACAAEAADWGDGVVRQSRQGGGGGGAGHGGTMHGSTFFSGQFKHDLCGGMIWGGKQHFLGGHFSFGGLSACGVADWALALGSGAGAAFL
jgi:hypothetical protein